jgi:ABC-type transport system involved in cytochrome c biogenesis permease subunit
MHSLELLLLYLVLLCYSSAAIAYALASFKRAVWLKIAFALAVVGWSCNLAVLLCHAYLSQRLPVTNGYEFISCFILLTVLIYLIYERTQHNHNAGGIVMLINALLTAAIIVLMPRQIGQAGPLMPALKSPWLTVHVITAIVAYSAFTLAAGIAVKQLGKHISPEDNAIYMITAFGFIMLSLSIILGAVWAEQVWGRYWTWDPKETWALVTWIIYAIFLHLYNRRNWRGNNARILVIAGFILVLFTFFGVNYLLPGLHSYA